MARFRRADEIVERDIEPAPRRRELVLHLIAVLERRESLLDGAAIHVLRVLVVAHQKTRLESRQALVARDHVGADLFVGRTEVRPAVDVINRRRQKKSSHERSTARRNDVS